jgi:transcriptional regulator with XRE-family HTH domain
MINQIIVGKRVRRLRTVRGWGQDEFAAMTKIATGTISKLENGRMPISEDLLTLISTNLGCTPGYLITDIELAPTTRPWLRAYADASKKTVDQQVEDSTTAIEAATRLDLRFMPDNLPIFHGDLLDPAAIDDFALEVRGAAGLAEGDVVGNCTRAAERLGCVVLPMPAELGRHLGLSVRANLVPVIRVSRPHLSRELGIPGDRQRFTVAHEIGHLGLHAGLAPPTSAEEASRIEKQAHAFAGAFLAPGDAMLDEIGGMGGRVTLGNLARIKERWGISIKALVTRFLHLGVIDPDQARSLFKQISARGWNKKEPVPVGNEEALWFGKALASAKRGLDDPLRSAANDIGLAPSYLQSWVEWSPIDDDRVGTLIVGDFRKNEETKSGSEAGATVSSLLSHDRIPRR